MKQDEYSLLSPFIQEFIYQKGWKDLRDIQKLAIQAILKTDYHLLITSGTASGKTEAAFLPILTYLDKNPSKSVGILYISPLKALINDQFDRLGELLKKSEIPIWHWHGDVSASVKQKVKKNPSGVLQMTPESLEAQVMRHPEDIRRIFSDLQFIVIDEVHSFMGTERGSQLLCLFNRIEELTGCHPRRIGLSATINNYTDAMLWLKSGTNRKVALDSDDTVKKKRVSVEYKSLSTLSKKQEETGEVPTDHLEYFNGIYNEVYGKNAIVFTNSRKDAEKTISVLKKIARDRRDNEDMFSIHHGSLSAILRQEAESSLRSEFRKTVTVATSTLELGIDIGDLDTVVQVGIPLSAASYVQRLGRAGRRSGTSTMKFYCSEVLDAVPIPGQLPWDLLQVIAVIELYDKEHWVEKFVSKKKPFSLLYQQTMSVLYASDGLTPANLARKVLTLAPFANVTKEEYRILLRHLLDIELLEQHEDSTLHIGLRAEGMVNYYGFYTVFEDKVSYRVLCNGKEVGTVESHYPTGSYLNLGGRTWVVTHSDEFKRIIEVSEANTNLSVTRWSGAGIRIDGHIVKKMRDILLSDEIYPYLNEEGMRRIEEGRELARRYDLCNCLVFEEEGKKYIFPWIGGIERDTLAREIKYKLTQEDDVRFVKSYSPHVIGIKTSYTRDELVEILHELRVNLCNPHEMIDNSENLTVEKYDYYIPDELLRTAYVEDMIRQDFVYL